MRRKKKIEEIEALEETEEIKEEPIEIEIADYYVLGVEETLEDVAKKFNLDLAKLKEMNGEVIGGNQIKLK